MFVEIVGTTHFYRVERWRIIAGLLLKFAEVSKKQSVRTHPLLVKLIKTETMFQSYPNIC